LTIQTLAALNTTEINFSVYLTGLTSSSSTADIDAEVVADVVVVADIL